MARTGRQTSNKPTKAGGANAVSDHDRRFAAEARVARRTQHTVGALELDGAELAAAKRDATVLAVKLQEDAGIDIVTEAEQARQHFVHGFLENIEGIDFAHKVEMGIRNDRYKAMVPQVVAPLRLRAASTPMRRASPAPTPHAT